MKIQDIQVHLKYNDLRFEKQESLHSSLINVKKLCNLQQKNFSYIKFVSN